MDIKITKKIKLNSGMTRDTTAGKPRYDLLVPKTMRVPMLERWAIHMAKGAANHGDRNWEQACTEEDIARFKESAFRHFMQWYQGNKDEDHASALFFNVQGAEYVEEQATLTDKEKADLKKKIDRFRL